MKRVESGYRVRMRKAPKRWRGYRLIRAFTPTATGNAGFVTDEQFDRISRALFRKK